MAQEKPQRAKKSQDKLCKKVLKMPTNFKCEKGVIHSIGATIRTRQEI